MKRLSVPVVSLFLVGASLAQDKNQSSGEAFQGLKWGDSVATIQKNFPQARLERMNGCEGDRLDPPAGNLSCMAVFLRGYAVVDLDFRVVFNLTVPDKKLAQVRLSSYLPSDQFPAVKEKCIRIGSLLTERYGRGRLITNSDGPGLSFTSVAMWDEGGGATNVKLECYGIEGIPHIGITYGPKVSMESKRL